MIALIGRHRHNFQSECHGRGRSEIAEAVPAQTPLNEYLEATGNDCPGFIRGPALMRNEVSERHQGTRRDVEAFGKA